MPHIVCPDCAGHLELTRRGPTEDGHIMEGGLLCRICGQEHPIRGGVPLLVPRDEDPLQRRVSEAFGYEWNRFPSHRDFMASSQLLRDFLQFREGADSPMANRVVVEGGCGSGRWLPRVNEDLGAAAVIGLDISDSVHQAFRLTRENSAVHVIQADVRKPPLSRSADAVYSIGVIDHLENPLEGFRGLLSCLKPGGLIFLWVYAHEGNQGYLRCLRPVRRWTTRMDRRRLSAVSRALGVLLHLTVHSIYRLPLPLPYRAYSSLLRKLRAEDIGLVLFDQLAPPVAHYMRKEEVEALFRDVGATLTAMFHRNLNSWTAHGYLP